MAQKKSIFKKIITWLCVLLLIAGAVAGYIFYVAVYAPNVSLHGKKTDFLYIPTGSNYDDVKTILEKNDFIKNKSTFE